MEKYSSKELGRLITRAHYQAWRTDAPPLDLTVDELAAILPNLIKSGSAGLIWPRVEPVRERYGALAFALEAAYASIREYNDRVRDTIATVIGRLHEAGISPVLIKGYALSHQYPSDLLRPAGDIDLVVHDDQYQTAQHVLHDFRLSFHQDADAQRLATGTVRSSSPLLSQVDVDLHKFSNWYGARDNRFYNSAETMHIGGWDILIPSRENHLRVLCLHFLRHSGMRPLWLCDIALLMDERPDAFDSHWSLDMGVREIEQVHVATSLATTLLGARVSGEIQSEQDVGLPSWIVSQVQQEWGASSSANDWWPNAIGATYRADRSYFARFAFVNQLWDVVTRGTRHALRWKAA